MEKSPEPMYPGELSDENICRIFEGAGDFIHRHLRCGRFSLFAYAIDGITAGGDIADYVFKPITEHLHGETMQDLYEYALSGMIYSTVARPCKDLDTAAKMLVNGFCVILFPGVGAIAFEAKTPEKRSLSGPELEHTSKGPKDAFVETSRTNTSLVRRHLRTPDLRIYETQVGRRSLTNVSVLWIEGLTNPEYVRRMKRRLADIDIDGMISPSSVEEYITGSRATAFPLLQYTERTDRFCKGLLQGRVGLIVDGLPLGYLAPVDIGYLMNSPEDLSRDYLSASWVRILRYIALFVGLLLPALFVAMTEFHTDLLPSMLRDMVQQSIDAVPYSSIWEILGLLIAFELLQESGIHLPQSIGQSVSIIGGIVIGTAAVEAGLISPLALISISIAGICGFVLPNRDLAAAVRGWRFGIAILASFLGLTGIAAGVILLAVHLFSLKSLGVRYVMLFEPNMIRNRMVKDKYRSKHLRPEDRRKQR